MLFDLGLPDAQSRSHDFANDYVSRLEDNWVCTSKEIEDWLDTRTAIHQSAQKAVWFPDFLDTLQERIKPDELAKQGFPRPNDVRLSQRTDSTGEEAYYVYLIFPDRTPEKALAWEKIEPMVSWVRNLIWTETGARLWPYVKVKRHKELAGGLA